MSDQTSNPTDTHDAANAAARNLPDDVVQGAMGGPAPATMQDQVQAHETLLGSISDRVTQVETVLGTVAPLADVFADLLPGGAGAAVVPVLAKLPVYEEVLNGILAVLKTNFGPHTGANLPSTVADAVAASQK